jgi:hypothetical protein
MRAAWSRSEGDMSKRRRHSMVQCIAFAVAVSMALLAAVPPGVVPEDGGFPLDLSWLRSFRPNEWPAAAFAGMPKQTSGGDPKDSGHYVEASVTAVDRGAGRAADRGIGARAPYERPIPQIAQMTTPSLSGEHSFNAQTSKREQTGATATSDLYRNADGSLTRKVYQAPVNYQLPDGSWRPIDRTLVRDAVGRFRPKAGTLDVSFGALLTRPWVGFCDLGLLSPTVATRIDLLGRAGR